MRILFLTNSVTDFGAAFLYNGLLQTFGPETVYDYPIKNTYHGGVGVGMWGAQQYKYGPLPWMPAYPMPYPAGISSREDCLAEVLRMLQAGEFDLCILESLRIGVREALAELGSALLKSDIPVILHDGEDNLGINIAVADFLANNPYVKVLLEREYPKTGIAIAPAGVHVLPFPFSYPDTANNFCHNGIKCLDVAYIAGETHPERRAVALSLAYAVQRGEIKNAYIRCNALSDSASVRVPEDAGWLSWRAYMEKMGDAELALSVRGAGCDTCRHWEAAAATALLRGRLDIVIPNDFVNGETCFEFMEPENVGVVVSDLLRDKRNIAAVRENGITHLYLQHTNCARIAYLFDFLHLQGICDIAARDKAENARLDRKLRYTP